MKNLHKNENNDNNLFAHSYMVPSIANKDY